MASTWPVGANILPRFQFEGKSDVWISQVRHVKGISFDAVDAFGLAFQLLLKRGSNDNYSWIGFILFDCNSNQFKSNSHFKILHFGY